MAIYIDNILLGVFNKELIQLKFNYQGRRYCVTVSNPQNLLFVYKECQDLRPPDSSPTVVPGQKTLWGKGVNFHGW